MVSVAGKYASSQKYALLLSSTCASTLQWNKKYALLFWKYAACTEIMLFAKETFHYSFVWAARLLSKEGENGIAIPEKRRALHLFGVVKRCRALPESLEHSTLLCAMSLTSVQWEEHLHWDAVSNSRSGWAISCMVNTSFICLLLCHVSAALADGYDIFCFVCLAKDLHCLAVEAEHKRLTRPVQLHVDRGEPFSHTAPPTNCTVYIVQVHIVQGEVVQWS